jgi:hypothetical protein
MLRTKADEVPRHGAVPGSLTRRVRFRLAGNALALGLIIVLLGAGTFVGARALSGPGSPKLVPPASRRTMHPTPGSTPTSSTSPLPCPLKSYRATGTLEGAAGSREGAITFTNFSDVSCTLQGRPTITLFKEVPYGTQGGFVLRPITSGVTYTSAPAGWVVNAAPTPPGWPVVTLAPGKAAQVRIRWSNWCPDRRLQARLAASKSPAPHWQMGGMGGGAGVVDVLGLDTALPPPCNGPGQPSTIEVGPFEPSPGA